MLSSGVMQGLAGLLLLVAAGLCAPAQTDSETIYHRFAGTSDGAVPYGLAFDTEGNLYGTTQMRGSGPCTFPLEGCGNVFEATPVRNASGAFTGRWEKRVIYTLQGGDGDGSSPEAAPAVGATGDLYGTTVYGGPADCGTVFQLQREGDHWIESMLYAFTCGSDGGTPNAVIVDSAGNIFGTTYNGGLGGCDGRWPCGVVYELQNTGSGWVETVLHSFEYKEGGSPAGGLVMDKSGNLYGTTPYGGSPHLVPFEPAGTIYELSPSPSGWSFQVLYRFPGGTGQSFAGLTLDAEGNLYGTATDGGIYGVGNVFELQRPTTPGDPWTFINILSFDGLNGSLPVSTLVFDKAGNLYGATGGGGNGQNCDGPCGVVFELTPSPDGVWTETVLYEFQGGTDGAYANATPVLDPWGNLYGTTAYGGDPNCIPFPDYSGCGVVYRIKHSSPQE